MFVVSEWHQDCTQMSQYLHVLTFKAFSHNYAIRRVFSCTSSSAAKRQMAVHPITSLLTGNKQLITIKLIGIVNNMVPPIYTYSLPSLSWIALCVNGAGAKQSPPIGERISLALSHIHQFWDPALLGRAMGMDHSCFHTMQQCCA